MTESKAMNQRLPSNTYLYFIAQSVNLTTAVMSVTMAALVGTILAPSPWMSTIPYGSQFLLVMLMTYPASKLMSMTGRKQAFLLATLPLAASGIAGFLAIEHENFFLFIISHALLGVYIAFANFSRFAAADGLPPHQKPRAISLVVAGGVLAAFAGPLITYKLKDIEGFKQFSLCYGAFIALAMLSMTVISMLKQESPRKESHSSKNTISGKIESKPIFMAIAVSALGYGVMNLIMIQSSMQMSNMHVQFSDISQAIQWHVLAMFAPSFFTGRIIQQLGSKSVLLTGITLLMASNLINMATEDYGLMTLSLISLGLGWNFTYIGGSTLLANESERNPSSSKQIQGLNDLGISIMATIGAFSPSILMTSIGWTWTNAACLLACSLMLILLFRLLKNKIHEEREHHA